MGGQVIGYVQTFVGGNARWRQRRQSETLGLDSTEERERPARRQPAASGRHLSDIAFIPTVKGGRT